MMLPLDILFYIFKYLRIEERLRLRTVCRRWSTLLIYPAVLRNLDFSAELESDWEVFDERYLDIALFHATSVVSLRLFQCDSPEGQLSWRSLIQASRNGKLKRLKHLSLGRTSLCDKDIIKILEGTQSLEHLDLLNTSYGEDVATNIAIFTSHSQRYLRFPDFTSYWRREKVENILDSCRNLECFSITKNIFTVSQMKSLLHQKKWRNIKKVKLHVDYEDPIRSDEDYIIRLVQILGPISSSPAVCLCMVYATLK